MYSIPRCYNSDAICYRTSKPSVALRKGENTRASISLSLFFFFPSTGSNWLCQRAASVLAAAAEIVRFCTFEGFCFCFSCVCVCVVFVVLVQPEVVCGRCS